MGPKGITFTKENYNIHIGICVPSEFIRKRHIELWDAPSEKIYVTGEAKIDYLLELTRYSKEKLIEKMKIKNINPKYKIILYAPTYDCDIWPWEDKIENLEQFVKFLSKHNTYLFLRTHPYYDKNKYGKILKKLSHMHWNLKLVPMDKYPDTMLVLSVSDILITDWSSIYTDYSILMRPIIFIDIMPEHYPYIRGKPLVPPEMRPGIMVKSKEELYKAIETLLRESMPSHLREELNNYINLVHAKVDGSARDRVIKIIENITQKETFSFEGEDQ